MVTCATCVYWQGTLRSIRAKCTHERGIPSPEFWQTCKQHARKDRMRCPQCGGYNIAKRYFGTLDDGYICECSHRWR